MLNDADLERLRRKLLAKGQELATKLSQLLEGQTPAGLDELAALPGERPEEKLRRYLAIIQARLGAIRAGGYGRCERCGAELSVAELDEMPWADACRACAASQ